MALQGTLDTFALSDVLRLLAATKKTGRLWVSGTRGAGSVWVDQGAVVAAEAPAAGSSLPADVLFELLRFVEGSFSFEGDTKPDLAGAPSFVEPLLAEAEERLKEWHLIAAVVPSLEARVNLALELPSDDVVIDAGCWRGIVAVAGGSTVGQIGVTLGLAEVPVSRRVKELVELGLVTVEVQAPAPTPAVAAEADFGRFDVADEGMAGGFEAEEVVPVPERYTPEPAPSAPDYFAPRTPAERPPLRAPSFQEFEPLTRTTTSGSAFRDGGEVTDAPDRGRDVFAPPAGREFLGRDTGREPGASALQDSATDDEVVRQLATLSPRAARAVAAAAKAETVEERDAALAEVNAEGEEPINRGLLLKFLSSVKQ